MDDSVISNALAALGTAQESVAVDALVPLLNGSVTALVTHLGPQLTATDEVMRERGTRLMAEVLWRLTAPSAAALPGGALDHLVGFFSDRLGDYLTIGAVLHGLSALVRMPELATALGGSGPLRIASTLLEQCDVRSLVQAQRHAAMTLTLTLVRQHWPSLAASGCRLLLSTVHALDGEKDPRNLLLYFQLLRALCESCEAHQVGGFEEAIPEVFESLSCYFPIAFTPPPNDPHQISAHHLLQALLRTLGSTARFGPHALKFFTEKLREATVGSDDSEDDALTARLQTLQSLAMLAPVYGAVLLRVHAATIGEALADLLMATDDGKPPANTATSRGSASSSGDGPLGSALGVALGALAAVAATAEAVVDDGGRSDTAGMAAAAATSGATGSQGDDSRGPSLYPPRSLLMTLLSPAISRSVSAPPSGPGAVVGGRMLTAMYAKAKRVGAPLLRQALPALLRRVTSPDGRHADRVDALTLLHATLSSACDVMASDALAASSQAYVPTVAVATAPAAGDGMAIDLMDVDSAATGSQGAGMASAGLAPSLASDIAAAGAICEAVSAHRLAVLQAAIASVEQELEWEADPPVRVPAGHLLCLALAPLGPAGTVLEEPQLCKGLETIATVLQAAVALSPSMATGTGASPPNAAQQHTDLIGVAKHASRLRAALESAPASQRTQQPASSPPLSSLGSLFDSAVRSPLLAAFKQDSGAAASPAATSLAPILAELCAVDRRDGASPPPSGRGSVAPTVETLPSYWWEEGVAALVSATQESITAALAPSNNAASSPPPLAPPLAIAGLGALARLASLCKQPQTASRSSVLPATMLAVLEELTRSWRHAASLEPPSPLLEPLLEAALPLWAEAAKSAPLDRTWVQ